MQERTFELISEKLEMQEDLEKCSLFNTRACVGGTVSVRLNFEDYHDAMHFVKESLVSHMTACSTIL